MLFMAKLEQYLLCKIKYRPFVPNQKFGLAQLGGNVLV